MAKSAKKFYAKLPIFFLLSVLLNGLTVITFLLAFIFPFNYSEFILGGVSLIYLFEFLNIHATGFLKGINDLKNKSIAMFLKIIVAIFYIWFIRGILFSGILMGFLFLFSLSSKVLFNSQSSSKNKFYLFQFFWFMVSIFAVTFLPISIVGMLDIPSEIFWGTDAQQGGLWNEYPQYPLLWGFIYYLGLIFIQIYLYKKWQPIKRKKISK